MDGWKLVPVEPNREMCLAARKAKSEHLIADEADSPVVAYRAMLAAAPVPPAGDEVEVLSARQSFDAWFTADLGLPANTNTAFVGAATEPWRVWKACSGIYSAHVTRLQTEKGALSYELAGAQFEVRELTEERDALQSELTKARELFVDMLKHTDGPGDFKWPVTMWFPAIRKLIANQSAPVANFIACKVDESCGQDAEAAKGEPASIDPQRIKGMIEAAGGEYAIMIDPENGHFGWTFKRHPDGQWVSWRRATETEMHAARQQAKRTGQGI